MLTCELAIVGGSSHPCLCVLKGIGVLPPFSQAAQINLWKMMDSEECYTLLTLVYSAVSAHSETILSNGRILLPSTPMK